jgi:hypothetical protein
MWYKARDQMRQPKYVDVVGSAETFEYFTLGFQEPDEVFSDIVGIVVPKVLL